jgi:oxygen-independent coproporphyrinogen III oxidase
MAEVIDPGAELLARYDKPGPRYTSYPTAPEWTESFGAADYARHLQRAAEQADEPLSLYTHLPFCKSLCWYCGCNVVIAKEQAAADVYLDHLGKEMDLACALLGQRRELSQLHWGGGTPTFLTLEQIERLYGMITSRFKVLPGAEVAIEIHPSITSRAQLDLLRRLGFNRISMGLQDFDPLVQQTTNRIQTAEQTHELLDYARSLGFSGINFDLIYGLPHQNLERWEKTLEKILAMRPDRLAVYSFAYMPDVLKHQKRMPAEAVPPPDMKLALFQMARRAFLGAGYAAIGMDHFAVPEDELAGARAARRLGRNFQGYTVRSAQDVVAFGATGISDVAGAYAQNVRPLPYYYDKVAQGQFAIERGITMTDEDLKRRRIIQQVMCNFWADLGNDFLPEREELRALEKDGLVRLEGDTLEVTALGHLFVRNVAMVFDQRMKQGGHTRFSRTV